MLEKFRKQIEDFINNHSHANHLTFDSQNLELSQGKYLITRAIVPDIQEILNLKRVICNSETVWDAAAFEKEFQNKENKLYLVMRHDDEIVGFISCEFNFKDKIAHMMDLAVMPEFGKLGISEKLVNILLLKASALKMKEVTARIKSEKVEVIGLYLQLGFAEEKMVDGYTYLKYTIESPK